MKNKVWRENGFLYSEKTASNTGNMYIGWFFCSLAVCVATFGDHLTPTAITGACMYVCWKQAAKYARIEKAIREANKEG